MDRYAGNLCYPNVITPTFDVSFLNLNILCIFLFISCIKIMITLAYLDSTLVVTLYVTKKACSMMFQFLFISLPSYIQLPLLHIAACSASLQSPLSNITYIVLSCSHIVCTSLQAAPLPCPPIWSKYTYFSTQLSVHYQITVFKCFARYVHFE